VLLKEVGNAFGGDTQVEAIPGPRELMPAVLETPQSGCTQREEGTPRFFESEVNFILVVSLCLWALVGKGEELEKRKV
jgi:hypothetical protein